MASSNASAVEQQISRETVQKSENAHRRQVGYILIEISGFGKTISNCQNSNHIGRTEDTSVTYLDRQENLPSACFYSCILKGKNFQVIFVNYVLCTIIYKQH